MSLSSGANLATNIAAERPDKRPRLAARRSGVINSRGVTACQRCRTRKTKCDNIRPSCGLCAKLDIDCVYADDAIPDPFQELGDRVLGAIDGLANVVKRQQQCCPNCSGNNNTNGSRESADPPSWPFSGPSLRDARSAEVNPYDTDQSPDEGRLQSQGSDTILSWSIFDQLSLPSLNPEGSDGGFLLSDTLPNLGRDQLTRLIKRYIRGVHIMNPILNLTEVRQIMNQIVETGPDWSTKTCLIALVGAIGSINSYYYDGLPIALTPESVQSPPAHDEDARLATQYWSLAVKRLALAIGQNDIQAVQCLCLAGIFCMHRVQPLLAWKYFSLAGAAWHVLNRTQISGNDVFARPDDMQSFTLMQSLYFTIWKSECELKMEVDVPGPILDNVNFPTAFPLPPELGAGSPAHEAAEHERVWLYYLAEIAIRHHLNRVLRTYKHFAYVGQPTNRTVERMLAHADMLEAQIQEWRASLPLIFQFDIPEGFELPHHSNEFTHILRTRYLSHGELVSRPFLRLCVETPVNFDTQTRRRVIELASRNVRFSVLKMIQAQSQVHQGTWLGLRSMASSALIMSSVYFARQQLWLSGSPEVELPDDWRDRLCSMYNVHAHFLDARDGSAQDISNLIRTILAASDPG